MAVAGKIIICYGLFEAALQILLPGKRFEGPISPTGYKPVYKVKYSVRGDVGPAYSSAGMIDRYILGIDHLYVKPVYRNMKECNGSNSDTVSKSVPSWYHAAFDPEGIVSSLTAAATSIIGLQYGHILVQFQFYFRRSQRNAFRSQAIRCFYAVKVALAEMESPDIHLIFKDRKAKHYELEHIF